VIEEEARREVLRGSRWKNKVFIGRRSVSGAVGLFVMATVALGCAPQDGDEPLPFACGMGPEAVRDALGAAPRPVRIDGTPLSACLDPTSDGTDLQAVGTSLVGAASELAGRAQRRPEGAAAMRLGYLVGAVQRGAGRANAQGINSELVRRIEQELALVDPGSRAVREGLRAGRSTG